MNNNKNLICLTCGNAVSGEKRGFCDKCKHYLNINNISIGDKVVYLPGKSSIIRGITDNAYNTYNFFPGDIFTIKGFEIDEGGFGYVLVNELKIHFSPYELVPYSEITTDEIMKIKEYFLSKTNK